MTTPTPDTTMHILCSTDDNYAPHCGVMLTSLLLNNPGQPIHIHIFTQELSSRHRSRFTALGRQYGQQVEFMDVDTANLPHLDKLKTTLSPKTCMSLSTYFRLFLTEHLPATVHKVLYLDCDLIVNHSLRPVYDIDITHKALAAADDEYYFSPEPNHRVGIDLAYRYFNAGVLLINVDYWRRHKVMERCLDYIRDHHRSIFLLDQDTLNAVVHSERAILPLEYNLTTGYIRTKDQHNFTEDIYGLLRDHRYLPPVIHFTGPIKPWNPTTYHPYKALYTRYLKKSLWRSDAIPYPSLRRKAECRLLHLLWLTGIKKRPDYYILYDYRHPRLLNYPPAAVPAAAASSSSAVPASSAASASENQP